MRWPSLTAAPHLKKIDFHFIGRRVRGSGKIGSERGAVVTGDKLVAGRIREGERAGRPECQRRAVAERLMKI